MGLDMFLHCTTYNFVFSAPTSLFYLEIIQKIVYVLALILQNYYTSLRSVFCYGKYIPGQTEVL